MTTYLDPQNNSIIHASSLSSLDEDTQTRVMEHWFNSHFENPAESTPYSSEEGGYVYIWGGPFDANDEIHNEFSGLVDEVLITKLANQLTSESDEWAPAESIVNYESALIQDIASITEFYHNFSRAIIDIGTILNLETQGSQRDVLLRLIYANVITALETYLCDAFVNNIINKPGLLRRFVETTDDFKDSKINVSDLFREYDGILGKVQDFLGKVVWHRLSRVSSLYKNTLNITFPRDIGEIYKSIEIRHDIIHRNGKNIEGHEILITKDDIQKLIANVESLVIYIDSELKATSNPLVITG